MSSLALSVLVALLAAEAQTARKVYRIAESWPARLNP